MMKFKKTDSMPKQPKIITKCLKRCSVRKKEIVLGKFKAEP